MNRGAFWVMMDEIASSVEKTNGKTVGKYATMMNANAPIAIAMLREMQRNGGEIGKENSRLETIALHLDEERECVLVYQRVEDWTDANKDATLSSHEKSALDGNKSKASGTCYLLRATNDFFDSIILGKKKMQAAKDHPNWCLVSMSISVQDKTYMVNRGTRGAVQTLTRVQLASLIGDKAHVFIPSPKVRWDRVHIAEAA